MIKATRAQLDQIWISTYAAAFVGQYVLCKQDGLGFDAALADNAESACTLADAAVEQLEVWIAEGKG